MTGQKKKDRTAARILHEAKGLFESNGVENISFDEIALQAGVSRSTVFNHFNNKGELLSTLATVEVEEVLLFCAESGEEGLALVETLLFKLIDDTVRYPWVMTRLANSLILSPEAGSIAKIEALLREAVKKALPDEPDDSLMAKILMGLYYGLVNHYHIHKLDFDPEKMKRDIRLMIQRVMKH